MQHGLVADGELVVADEGDTVACTSCPQVASRMFGRRDWPDRCRVLSWTRPLTFSLQTASGKFASHHLPSIERSIPKDSSFRSTLSAVADDGREFRLAGRYGRHGVAESGSNWLLILNNYFLLASVMVAFQSRNWMI